MNKLKFMLNKKGIKQVELAIKLGVAKSSVSQWCSNRIQPPLGKLNEIADAIGCDVTDLLVSKKKRNN